MEMSEKSANVPVVTKSDIDWLNDRIDRVYESISKVNTKIKLLVRILVDKKTIGPELAKTFEEARELTPEDIQKLLKYLDES